MSLESEFRAELYSQGADFVYFADTSQLSNKQNKGYSNAILFGVALSPEFIQILRTKPRIELVNNEFQHKEAFTDKLADHMAEYISTLGYSAYSQSEANIYSSGNYNESRKSTPLPHKTIAGLAGLGWIGKHNLLVSPQFGSAISVCTVLTDAPLETVLHAPESPQCGDCTICIDICPVEALTGNTWDSSTGRDEMLDVYKCTSCLKCMALCPRTQEYLEKQYSCSKLK